MIDKREERRVLIRKIIIIVFLVVVVIGFTVPTLLDLGNNQLVPPRVCQADADCYLMCSDVPMAVLCSQNLCVQNSCTESSVYPLNNTPLAFELRVEVNRRKSNLSEVASSQDIFVKFTGDSVSVFSEGLSLKQVLEKVKVSLNAQCLILNQSYCSDNEHKLKFLVNGNASYAFEGYVPQNGDKVEISYS